jgi:hypothetical protein
MVREYETRTEGISMSSEPIKFVPKDGGDAKARRQALRASRTPTIETKLLAADHERFERLCRIDGKTKSEVIRDAVNLYLDIRENNLLEDRDSKLSKQMQKGFDRLAAIFSRSNIDVGMIYQIIYDSLPEKTRNEKFYAAHKIAVERSKKQLSQDEAAIKNLI